MRCDNRRRRPQIDQGAGWRFLERRRSLYACGKNSVVGATPPPVSSSGRILDMHIAPIDNDYALIAQFPQVARQRFRA